MDDAAIMDVVAPKARKAYNLDQMTSIDGPDGKVRACSVRSDSFALPSRARSCLSMSAALQFLVTEVGEVGENEYVDPKAGKVHTVNHMEKVHH